MAPEASCTRPASKATAKRFVSQRIIKSARIRHQGSGRRVEHEWPQCLSGDHATISISIDVPCCRFLSAIRGGAALPTQSFMAHAVQTTAPTKVCLRIWTRRNRVGQNTGMFSLFSLLPFVIYAPVVALLIIGIWVGVLGIRALNKYLREPTSETKPFL